MVKLDNERVEQILQNETMKTQPLPTILRGIYTRYINLYEDYIAEIDKLTDDKIDAYKRQNAETQSLIKYYYMDIPQDVCYELNKFEENVADELLGREWKRGIYDAFEEFKENNDAWNKSDDYYMAEFKKALRKELYKAMENIFRDGFGTHSETAKNIFTGISNLLFGSSKER